MEDNCANKDKVIHSLKCWEERHFTNCKRIRRSSKIWFRWRRLKCKKGQSGSSQRFWLNWMDYLMINKINWRLFESSIAIIYIKWQRGQKCLSMSIILLKESRSSALNREIPMRPATSDRLIPQNSLRINSMMPKQSQTPRAKITRKRSLTMKIRLGNCTIISKIMPQSIKSQSNIFLNSLNRLTEILKKSIYWRNWVLKLKTLSNKTIRWKIQIDPKN